MFMNSIYAKPLGILLILIMVGATGFGAGWKVQGWRKDTTISELKNERATDRATQATTALEDVTKATNEIHKAALEYSAQESELGSKMDAIRKDLKNVQAKAPLPPDCKPTTDRLRNLKSAIDATNSSITR